MIEVTGTKAPAPSQEPSRERYTAKAATAFSSVPIYLMLILAASVVYLRSFFPSHATPGDGGQDAPAPEQAPSLAAESLAEVAEVSEAEAEVEEAPEEPVRSSSAMIEEEQPSFVMVDSPTITFKAPDVSVRTDNDIIELRPRAGNDNLSPDRSAPGGSAPDGGGNAPDLDDDDGDEDTNRAPRAQGSVYLGEFVSGVAVVITFASLLQNSSDPDGDALAIRNVSVSSGTLTPVQGGWLYTPAEGVPGFGTISYTLSDGTMSVAQAAHFRVVTHHTINGTAGDDALLGSVHADQIDARGGDDNVDAREGDDIVAGGSGNDHIRAGAGKDLVRGGDGDDLIFAGSGNDIVSAGAGNDRVFGEEGNDTLNGDEGDDFLSGGIGKDALMGDEGDDEIQGGEGDDVASGGIGDDRMSGDDGDDRMFGDADNDDIEGGKGDDVLDGGADEDKVSGGEGDDEMVGSLDAANDTYDGGTGFDTANYSGTKLGVLVDLTTGEAVGVEIGKDLLKSIEQVLGGEGEDTFIVAGQPTELCGGDGDDEFHFTALAVGSQPTAHTIHDFMVGDRIYVADYEISKRTADDVEDLFEDIYGDREDHHGRSIRYRNEQVDKMDRTRIEADLDGDAVYELAINLDGHHVLFIADNLA